MPSHHSDDDDNVQLPYSAKPISESDYFQKSDEFRVWLKDEKRKYFDELTSDKARSYFRKFVKAWNRGKLSKSLYAGVDPADVPASAQTAYKWSFASKSSRKEDDALKAVRAQVGAATKGSDVQPSGSGGSRGKMQGPTLPSASDMTMLQEDLAMERSYKRKRENREDKDRVEDAVGPREVGREGMLEKKRLRREGDRAFREGREDAGLEVDEGTLLGGGDSFQAQIARRDASKQKYQRAREEKMNESRERANAFKEKEKATMDMFQQLAKQRFG